MAGRRIVMVDPQLVVNICGFLGIPHDAKIRTATWDFDTGTIIVGFEHDSFPEQPAGYVTKRELLRPEDV